MHVLFVHPEFPGQFGQVARSLARERGYRCTFLTAAEAPTEDQGIRVLRYRPAEGAKARSYLSQDFDQDVAHAAGAYEAVKALRRRLEPDLVVGHAGWGPTLFLPELYPNTPHVGYFEYFYHPHGSAVDFRADWPPSERAVLRHRLQNATIMLQLESCAAGYTPTRFQHGLLPHRYRDKVRIIHDGVDTRFWRRPEEPAPSEGDKRIVTFVSRGLEAMRGFDVFMRVAKRIYETYPNVVFLVVGWDSVEYGNELELISERTFKEYVLKQDDYDLERIRFLGPVAPESLAQLLYLSDLHIYLTVPFVLSWSLLDAMASECVVLASATEPVQEVITEGENGLLRGFFDVEGMAQVAVEVLKDPRAYRSLGRAARQTVVDRYSLDVVVPELARFFEDVAGGD